MVAKKKKLLNQKGQALIEFVLFLPFLLILYSVTVSLGGAISASINQQKVTRSYFYYRLQNNSMAPKINRNTNLYTSWNMFGLYFIGWMERFADGNRPLATCYRLKIPMQARGNDQCEEGYEGTTTQYIRIGTVYGICGATYQKVNSGFVRHPAEGSALPSISGIAGCTIQ